MSVKISSARLEMVRLVREHCYQVADQPGAGYRDVAPLARAALDVPVEEMADWFMMDETVLANIRLAMTMVEQRFEPA